jgi:hypothetical protein
MMSLVLMAAAAEGLSAEHVSDRELLCCVAVQAGMLPLPLTQTGTGRTPAGEDNSATAAAYAMAAAVLL